ncbi:hypothetical protein SAMN05518854_104234 [Variovorax sp. YR266]|uniref:DUF6314 family protein n=1 Tax=Variovorax sp. YR266 TaxID=1884386 RepID=UPI00089B91A7|nr:DUF6314 family protein [Variovorax sp. YR266]SDZ20791.1 hypothetical protein SAMN05518854_104234 [Variovorax sp. YR266]
MSAPAPAFPPPPPWGTADTVFDRLVGAWDLERTIEGQASMTGTAMLTPLETGMLKYREEGRIRLADGKEFDGHREYLFERAPGGFVVHFAETPPRLFHAIGIMRDGDALAGSATHLCTPDTYDSSYRFLADGSFTIRHTVHGPRKDYLSATVFRRRGK